MRCWRGWSRRGPRFAGSSSSSPACTRSSSTGSGPRRCRRRPAARVGRRRRLVREWTVIARREFIERVRTRWFIFVTLLAPIGMVLLLVVPAWLAVSSAEKKSVIQVVDRTGRDLVPGLVRSAGLMGANLDLQPVPPDTDEALLLRRIRDETMDGFLVLPANLLAGGAATYR